VKGGNDFHDNDRSFISSSRPPRHPSARFRAIHPACRPESRLVEVYPGAHGRKRSLGPALGAGRPLPGWARGFLEQKARQRPACPESSPATCRLGSPFSPPLPLLSQIGMLMSRNDRRPAGARSRIQAPGAYRCAGLGIPRQPDPPDPGTPGRASVPDALSRSVAVTLILPVCLHGHRACGIVRDAIPSGLRCSHRGGDCHGGWE